MAGTMMFEVHVAHIYQRRFEVEDLRKALSSSYWYIISRCRRVRIIADSIRIDNDIVSLKAAVRGDGDEIRVEPLVLDVSPFGSVESFHSHLDGAYFVMVVSGQVIHGDAWSLASLFTGARGDIAAQEVLYVGQSFAEGRSDASVRTSQHKTLQKIYEDHGGSSYDIFVSPLELDRRSESNDDHLDDVDDGSNLAAFFKYFAEPGGLIKQLSVNLIEHALIAYFDPHYNQKLRQWNHASPTKAMRKMRECGFRLLVVNLAGGDGLARFHSRLVTDTYRNHLICHDLPPEPARPQLRGVSAEVVSAWRPAAQMVRHGRQLFANLGEYSAVALRVFGDEAPRDRRPSEVMLPDVASAAQRVSQALPQTRATDRIIKKRRRQILQLRRSQSFPPRPTYKKGAIKLGTTHDDHDALWWLYDTACHVLEHGFILGDGEGGDAASLLNLIAHEAVRSRKFTVMTARHSLSELLEVLDDRVNSHVWRKSAPSRRTPGLVALVPSVDALITDTREAGALRRVLHEGADLGIAAVMGITDLDTVVKHVGGLVVDVRNQYSTAPDGAAQVGSARTGLRSRRSKTQGDPHMTTFLLTAQLNDQTVAELVGTFDADLSFEQVKKAANLHVRNTDLARQWSRETDAEMWIALNGITADFWILRRHDDAWALCRVLARIGGREPGPRSEQLAWAEAVLQQNYVMPSVLSDWEPGPTFALADSETLYCSVPSSHLKLIHRTSVNWRAT